MVVFAIREKVYVSLAATRENESNRTKSEVCVLYSSLAHGQTKAEEEKSKRERAHEEKNVATTEWRKRERRKRKREIIKIIFTHL